MNNSTRHNISGRQDPTQTHTTFEWYLLYTILYLHILSMQIIFTMMILFTSNKPPNTHVSLKFRVLLYTWALYIAETLCSVNNLKKKNQSLQYSESGQKTTRSHCWVVMIIGTIHTQLSNPPRGSQAGRDVPSVSTYLDGTSQTFEVFT